MSTICGAAQEPKLWSPTSAGERVADIPVAWWDCLLMPTERLEGGNVRVSVHAEEAEGSWNYTGGVAGGVRFGALVSDVTVAGNVTGGKVADYKETNTHAAVGGWWVMSTRHR
mgnify:CR=1 FL=1